MRIACYLVVAAQTTLYVLAIVVIQSHMNTRFEPARSETLEAAALILVWASMFSLPQAFVLCLGRKNLHRIVMCVAAILAICGPIALAVMQFVLQVPLI